MMRSLLIATACCVVTSVFQVTMLPAQIVPYRVIGTGVADPQTNEFYGPAIGRHLGRMVYAAQATELTPVFDSNGNLVGFEYEAFDVQTAADGSEICLDATGAAVLIPRPDLGPTMFEAVWDG